MSAKLDAIRGLLAGVHNRADLCLHMQGASREMMSDIILLVVGRKLLCWQVQNNPARQRKTRWELGLETGLEVKIPKFESHLCHQLSVTVTLPLWDWF